MVIDVWRRTRVFLTGHTGFKGGWLALWLASKGALVRGYALEPSASPCFFESSHLAKHVDDCRGDIRNGEALQRSMRDFAPDLVFHLAAQPLVRHSYADPVETYATNVLGTVQLLEAVRNTPSVRAAVVVTTDKCYENREWHWGYRESDRLGGHDPYSSSKACAELVSASYRASFFAPSERDHSSVLLATARSGNVIGGGDWSEDRLIPDLIRGFLDSHPVTIRRPNSVRPWQHVLEPLAGYMNLGLRLLSGDSGLASAWNFGPYDEDAWTVGRIADFVVRRLGSGSWIVNTLSSVHEAGYLKLDASKAREVLGWHPVLRMNTALEWTIDWYEAWNKGKDMHNFSLDQIGAYEKLLYADHL